MIEIKEIDPGSKAIKTFVKFPFQLYKNAEHWVPPIISDEIQNFNPAKNPSFKSSQSVFLLAYKNGKVAGRIVGILNQYEPSREGKSIGRFGWFDCINDQEVAVELFKYLEKWAFSKGIDIIEGPEGFSNLDKAGLLVEGFDNEQLMSTIYNFPYYKDLLEKVGYRKDRDFIEFNCPRFHGINERFVRGVKFLEKRYGFKVAKIETKRDLEQYLSPAFEVLNKSYENLPGFVPLTKEQRDYYGKKFLAVLNPSMVKVVLDKNDDFAGFSVMIPHINEGLKKAKGKLFPFGWWHLNQALKNTDSLDFVLIGVVPEHQNKGLTALIFHYSYESIKDMPFKWFYYYPQLEENLKVQTIWKNFDLTQSNKRRIFSKKIV